MASGVFLAYGFLPIVSFFFLFFLSLHLLYGNVFCLFGVFDE